MTINNIHTHHIGWIALSLKMVRSTPMSIVKSFFIAYPERVSR